MFLLFALCSEWVKYFISKIFHNVYIAAANILLYLSIFSDFIKAKFLQRNKNQHRDIFAYSTTATDTNLVKHVIDQIYQIILRGMMDEFAWFLVTSMKVTNYLYKSIFLSFSWTSKMRRTLIYFLPVLVMYEINSL